MKGTLIALGILGGLASIPIWRGAGHSRHDGVSFWRMLHDSTRTLQDSPFGHPHISYDEAVSEAMTTYQEIVDLYGS